MKSIEVDLVTCLAKACQPVNVHCLKEVHYEMSTSPQQPTSCHSTGDRRLLLLPQKPSAQSSDTFYRTNAFAVSIRVSAPNFKSTLDDGHARATVSTDP